MIPVSEGREGWFLLAFVVQYLLGWAGIGVLAWLDPNLTYVHIATLAAALVVLAAAHSIILVEGIPMLAERYLKRRYEEGQAEGEKKGRAANQKLWEAWNQRRLQAEAANQPFNEPPPSLNNTAAGNRGETPNRPGS